MRSASADAGQVTIWSGSIAAADGAVSYRVGDFTVQRSNVGAYEVRVPPGRRIMNAQVMIGGATASASARAARIASGALLPSQISIQIFSTVDGSASDQPFYLLLEVR